MALSRLIELLATASNIAANAVLAHRMCNEPRSPVPVAVLALQLLGNSLWISYAALDRDAFLGTTAAVSLAMQTASLLMRTRPPQRRPGRSLIIEQTDSEGELPQLPPLRPRT